MTTTPALPRFLRAFSSRNYRLFFGGQGISLVGTWMTQTASLWLAYRLGHSAVLLGLVGFCSQFPIFLLGPVAGVLADQADRRRLLIGTQVASLVQSAALAAGALTGELDVTGLVLLSLLQGIINAVDIPCRQSFVVQMVDRREDLGNAIALNSSLFNLARLLGPAIGGLVIAQVGAAGCYVADAASYLPVIGGLALIRPGPSPAPRRPGAAGGEVPLAPAAGEPAAAGAWVAHAWTSFREGWAHAAGAAPVRALLVNVAALSFTGFAASVLMPLFARDVFGGDARTLGWLLSASGLGALGGALYLSTRQGIRGLGAVIALGTAAMGVGLAGSALCPRLPLTLVCLTLAGAGGVLAVASSNTVLQSLTDDRQRGRTMSLFAMAFTGTTPVGNVVAGFLAGRVLGPRGTLLLYGLCCVATAERFRRQLPRLRAAVTPAAARPGELRRPPAAVG